MTFDFSPLTAELARWRADNLALPVWWRDDDAVEPTPALHRLLSLARQTRLPVHLAVIPQGATRSLAGLCTRNCDVVPMVHGWSHVNHAPQGEKKAEFGHPRSAALAETKAALDGLRILFGPDLLPVFVPPWNRIDPSVTAGLAAQGYTGLSAFTPRSGRLAAPRLVQINTHIDPIFWKGGGGLVDPDTQIAALADLLKKRRAGLQDASEPLGLLTHHLVHDAAIWRFSEALIMTLLDGGAAPCNLRDSAAALP